VGRGILIDYYSWAQEYEPYDPLETYSIPLVNIKKCISAQGLEIRKGDILFIRSGFTSAYSKLDDSAKELMASVHPNHNFAGVEQCETVLEWIWNEQFAAVAGDSPTFEAWRISLKQ
jgi:hypothetical protein